jgi:hypothetical protein
MNLTGGAMSAIRHICKSIRHQSMMSTPVAPSIDRSTSSDRDGTCGVDREAPAFDPGVEIVEPLTARGIVRLGAFASEKAAHSPLVDAFKAMLALWSSGSCSLRGALIAALSLIPHSKKLGNAIADSGWQWFAFGRRNSAFSS